jgi:hypothetical protein
MDSRTLAQIDNSSWDRAAFLARVNFIGEAISQGETKS